MTKQDFIELTGEDPEDMFGGDWETLLEEFEFNPDKPYEFASDWMNGNL